MAIRLPATLTGYRWLSRLWAGVAEAAADLSRAVGVPLCVDGCGLCCLQTPSALGIEAERAASWLLGRPRAEQDLVLDGIEEWLLRPVLEVTDPESPSLVVRRPLLGDGPIRPAELAACARGRCPLLGPDRRCRVYPVRPLACRAYGVTHLAGRYCRRPRGLGETEDGRLIAAGEIALRLQTLLAGLRDAVQGDARLSWSQLFPTALYGRCRPDRLRELAPRIPSARLAGGSADPARLFADPAPYPAVRRLVAELAADRRREEA